MVAGPRCGYCISPKGAGRCLAQSSQDATECTKRGLFALSSTTCPLVKQCSKAKNCNNCKAISGCGWCKGSGKCQLSKGSCKDADWNPTTCPI
jgi:hypothetical protein